MSTRIKKAVVQKHRRKTILSRKERIAQPQDMNEGLNESWENYESRILSTPPDIEEARTAFYAHWCAAEAAADTLLQWGNNNDVRGVAKCLEAYSRSVVNACSINEQSGALDVVFRMANFLSSVFVRITKKEPLEWMKAISNQYETAWVMVNGKPVADYPAGITLLKRGKSSFAAPSTKAVANAIMMIKDYQNGKIEGCLFSKHLLQTYEATGLLGIFAKYGEEVDALPPLCQNSKNAWWKIISAIIKSNPGLTACQLDCYRSRAHYMTDKAAISEFIKDCKRALTGLCPQIVD